jgi:hypothetical protein
VERVERAALVDRQIAGTLKAAGATIDLVSVEDARQEFDAALNEAPKALDPEQLELRRALGMA